MAARLRVFIACSLDGFIAGPDGDLSWLPTPPEGSNEDFGWGAFIGQIGCMLMGRGTYDAVAKMGIDWPHTERDTIIATNRPLDNAYPRITAMQGSIQQLVDLAKGLAGDKDVYIDGGNLIRQALDADLIDEMIVTLCPVILGAGHSLFAGAHRRHTLKLLHQRELCNLVQLTYTSIKSP